MIISGSGYAGPAKYRTIKCTKNLYMARISVIYPVIKSNIILILRSGKFMYIKVFNPYAKVIVITGKSGFFLL